jgi:PAS domain-containing protein
MDINQETQGTEVVEKSHKKPPKPLEKPQTLQEILEQKRAIDSTIAERREELLKEVEGLKKKYEEACDLYRKLCGSLPWDNTANENTNFRGKGPYIVTLVGPDGKEVTINEGSWRSFGKKVQEALGIPADDRVLFLWGQHGRSWKTLQEIILKKGFLIKEFNQNVTL